MQDGDISNEVSARLLVVFEGLIGHVPDMKARAREQVALRRSQWTKAVAQYELNEIVMRNILDVVWRHKFSVDVVTFKGDGFAEAVAERLAQEGIPVGQVWATEPGRLARSLAYMPHVAAVYDPDPSHAFTYGSKGYNINPAAPHFF